MIIRKKKVFAVSLLTIFLLGSILIPLTSAFYVGDVFSRGPNDVVNMVIDFFTPFFQAILGYDSGYDQYFFARILLLIVVYIVSSIALGASEFFKDKKGANFIISAAIAILGARYLGGTDIMETILLPYGAVTIALSILLPFLVFFFFVHNAIKSGVARRAAWIFFAVIFIGFWWTRRQEAALGQYAWIYNVGVLAVLAAIVFDSKVHEYFGLVEAAEFKRGIIKKQIADVEAELTKYANVPNPSKTTQEVQQNLEKRRADLARKL